MVCDFFFLKEASFLNVSFGAINQNRSVCCPVIFCNCCILYIYSDHMAVGKRITDKDKSPELRGQT